MTTFLQGFAFLAARLLACFGGVRHDGRVFQGGGRLWRKWRTLWWFRHLVRLVRLQKLLCLRNGHLKKHRVAHVLVEEAWCAVAAVVVCELLYGLVKWFCSRGANGLVVWCCCMVLLCSVVCAVFLRKSRRQGKEKKTKFKIEINKKARMKKKYRSNFANFYFKYSH